MSKELTEIEKIRLKYKVLSDSKVSDPKILLALEEAKTRAILDGLESSGDILVLATRHMATYLLLLDVGLTKKSTQKESSSERFDTDPAAAELKIYKSIVEKYKENELEGNNFIGFLTS